MKMKKLVPGLIAPVVVIAVIISSCTKKSSFACTCTLTSGVTSQKTITYNWGKMNQGDAQARCDAKESAFSGLVYSCELH